MEEALLYFTQVQIMLDPRVINVAGIALDEKVIQAFGEFLRGELIRPGDESYDRSRRVWKYSGATRRMK